MPPEVQLRVVATHSRASERNRPRPHSMRTVNTCRLLVAIAIGFNSLLFNKLSAAETCPSFTAARTFKVGSSPYAVATGDFNGDGRLDLVAGTYSSSNVFVLLSNGDGTFQTA